MKRSKFSLSNYKLLSCDMGELVPVGLTEVLPGDSIQQSTNCLVRTQPLLAPLMHPVHVRIHHWFIPNRILWTGWEDFITGGPDGDNSDTVPQIDFSGSPVAAGDLANYLGLPVGYPLVANALPFRAYALCYNEWYRDQDLIDPLTVSTADGPDSTTSTALQQIGWEKDFYTRARPWEQKGPDITIPLGTSAPIAGVGVTAAATDLGSIAAKDTAQGAVTYDDHFTSNSQQILIQADGSDNPQVFADLTDASAITVTALREALGLQRYEEARARYGSRYTEYLRYLGVRSSDARLQRPEYLGGGSQVLQFSEVLQTAEGDDYVGTMRGHGITSMRSNRYRRFIEEHGYVMTLLSARPKTVYMDTTDNHWGYVDKENYWQKELEHIGQQVVYDGQVYSAAADPSTVFGYTDRYEQYRTVPSRVAGEFATTDLNFWHMAREFASEPALNAAFVNCNPTHRVFPVTDKDQLYIMARHSIQARRLVSKQATSFIF